MIREKAKNDAAAEIKKQLAALSTTWEAIQKAHDRTETAVPLHEADLQREFWTQALADLATVQEEATRAIRRAAIFMVEDLNMATRTVGPIADVAHSTVGEWIRRKEYGRD